MTGLGLFLCAGASSGEKRSPTRLHRGRGRNLAAVQKKYRMENHRKGERYDSE